MGQHAKVTIGAISLGHPHHSKYKWAVYWPAGEPGKPKRSKRFKSEDEAKKFRTRKETELLRDGRQAANLRESTIQEALWAQKALEPFGVSLRRAVEDYIERNAAASRSKSLQAAVKEFLAAKLATGKSARYLGDLRNRIGAFVKAGGTEAKPFGNRLVSEISARDVDRWLASLGGSPITRNNYRRALVVFFSWSEKMGLCQGNPARDSATATEISERVEVFTPPELRIILEHAPAGLIPQFALGAFAGLRTAEIERLRWEKVNFSKGRIEVDAKVAKGAAHRYVPIPPALVAWLAPVRKDSGPVQASSLGDRLRAYRSELAESAQGRDAVAWKQNGMRHSFGSYSMALTEDAGRVAAWMGHTNPQMLFRHYRERVDKDEAEEWFNVLPASPLKVYSNNHPLIPA
jgi:integrase